MTNLPNPSLHGIAVYNPDLLSKQELKAQFIAREPLLKRLVADLRIANPQPKLIVAARGMGKTTLLHRLGYAVDDDPKLSRRWLPLKFPEDQYNVVRLADFYLNCLDALGDALEQRGRTSEAEKIDQFVESIESCPEDQRASRAKSLLLECASELGKGFILLIDNAERILDRLKESEEWALRNLLSEARDKIVLIGATTQPWEAGADYAKAFYDFFQMEELQGFNEKEARNVLSQLSRLGPAPKQIEKWLNDPARFRVLLTLTGGNPRTIVLLYNLLVQGVEGDVRSDLDRLLDSVTPLYNARFEQLPEQAQLILQALALNWDPITAGELAEQVRLKSGQISSQLSRLKKQGIVEQVSYYPGGKIAYQVSERFFNIWYLMRANRRVRQKLRWFVEFLKLFYSQEANETLKGTRNRTENVARRAIELDPKNASAAHTLAVILARQDRWLESLTYARRFIAEWSTKEYEKNWSGIVEFFGHLVQHGHAGQAAELLRECDMTEKWRPLAAAINAATHGTALYFRRVAPEIQEPALKILKRLSPELEREESKESADLLSR